MPAPRTCLVAAALAALTAAPATAPSSSAGSPAFPASPYTGLSVFRTFDSFAGQCYAVARVPVNVDGPDLARANVGFDYPRFYRPTWGEVFDHVARQMRCRWAYDPARHQYQFDPSDAPPEFGVTLAPGWRREDRGLYVWHAPADQPFGLDVYDDGHYTADPADPDSARRVREHFALRDVAGWPHPPTLADMAAVRVAGVDALYLRADTPRPGGLWRQWTFILDGHAIVVVSVMPKDREATLGPAVDAMVASFGRTPPTTAPAK